MTGQRKEVEKDKRLSTIMFIMFVICYIQTDRTTCAGSDVTLNTYVYTYETRLKLTL